MHPLMVGNILREYGFDEHVIAAGFLHDVLEDTSYRKEDLERIFGSDITSLVVSARETTLSIKKAIMPMIRKRYIDSFKEQYHIK